MNRNAYQRAYYAAHRDKKKAYYIKNKKRIKAYKRKYYLANKKRILERQKIRSEEIAEYRRKRYLKNAEKFRLRSIAYYNSNKLLKLAYNKRRRALKNNAEGTHTIEDWEALKNLYDFTCLCCGKKEPKVCLTEDHIVPLSKDGSDWIWNIQPLCHSCNSQKHTSIIKY